MIENSIVQLEIDEEVLGIIRKSLWVEAPSFIFSLIWLLVPFFFFFPLIQLGGFGLIVFLMILISGIWNAYSRKTRWKYTMLIITDKRIIDVDQIGIFERSISELTHEDVSEVTFKKKGLFGKMLDFGSVKVQTTRSMHFDLEITGVRRPENVRNLLLEVQYITSPYVQASKTKE